MLVSVAGCASTGAYDVYHDEQVDFGLIQTVAVLPFANLTKEERASARVRDVFTTMLMASSGIYVLPPGEVRRGMVAAGVGNHAAPTSKEIIKFASVVKVDAVITGVVREYGEVRSATISSNVISLSLKMMEAQAGRIIWTASSTQGGVGFTDRLLGSGGQPLNWITEKAIRDVLDKLFE